MANDLSPPRAREIDEFDPFAARKVNDDQALDLRPSTHLLPHGFRCDTDSLGHATPDGLSPADLVLNASEGFIPLWDTGVTLRWRFAQGTLDKFENPAAAEAAIEGLLAAAIIAWGDAAPVKFSKRSDAWDFEIVVKGSDDCEGGGCVLASAFFPDAGRHQLIIYPMMFRQTKQEQLETMAHEIGHVFGLRHFFALVEEKRWRAEIFGAHDPFTIMNYGDKSQLTPQDQIDLKRLYALVWSGDLRDVNGTPIRRVRPYHETPATTGAVAIAAARG